MLPYFPFPDEFDLKMGTSLFTENDRLVEIDEHYLSEISQKRRQLDQDHAYYYRSLPDFETAQWDVLEKVLTDLVKFQPQDFRLSQNRNEWIWENRLLHEKHTFTFGKADTLPFEPLDWLGRQVQEDLAILSHDGKATLVAGQLCFLNGWSLDDKFGKTFLGIHAPAPVMIAPTMKAAQKLLEHIPPQKSLWRASWNFKITDQLDMSSRHTTAYNAELQKVAPELTKENIGEKIFIRIERQTLSSLNRSGCILFGIHTYQNTLAGEAQDPLRAKKMWNVISTTPQEMLDYKAISPFETALLGFLEAKC